MSVTLKPRWGHSLTAFSLGPGLIEVIVFGGSAEPWTGSAETQPKLADTTLLEFSECTFLCYFHDTLLHNWLKVPWSPLNLRTLFVELEHYQEHHVYIMHEVIETLHTTLEHQ